MSTTPEPDFNPGRRRFLVAATSVVGGAAVVATAVPFIQSMAPSVRALAAGAPVDADISKLKKGQMLTVKWRSKPVMIVHRTDEQIEKLPTLNDRLQDPTSEAPQEPPGLSDFDPVLRSIKPQYVVLVGICTHLGCVPLYKPEPGSLGPRWPGGFFCPCHGSHYDLAGRVFLGAPAPLNLPVPAYFYASDSVLRIGSLPDGSAQNWQPAVW